MPELDDHRNDPMLEAFELFTAFWMVEMGKRACIEGDSLNKAIEEVKVKFFPSL